MSGPYLFDPATSTNGDWPAGSDADRAYLTAFATQGSRTFISNLTTKDLALRSGGRVFPVTVNDAEVGEAYVCLPHTAYALYAKAELGLVDAGPFSPLLGLLIDGAGGLLKSGRINKVVHVGNWMLSTNLHGGWDGADVRAIRALLIQAFPDHLLAVRSINRWSDPALANAFEADGWRLLPSRQIYVTDDLARDWRPRRDTRRDLALLTAASDRIDPLITLRPGDAARICELYDLLYLGKYSRLNPAFTEAFIEMTHATGMLRYRGVRAPDGQLETVVGAILRGGVLTTPIVGYDTARPPADGLYRMASAMLAMMAEEAGAKLNGSAGAAAFKRHRGAEPLIEYTAYDARHLGPGRRAMIAGLQSLLNTVGVPVMEGQGL